MAAASSPRTGAEGSGTAVMLSTKTFNAPTAVTDPDGRLTISILVTAAKLLELPKMRL